jgi:hypothetical protein
MYQLNKKLLTLPFTTLLNEYNGIFENPLIEEWDQIKDKAISNEQMTLHLNEFERVYDLFRPDEIKKYHPYHGTVKVMEPLFQLFWKLFELDLPQYCFSSWGVTKIDQLMYEDDIAHDINWEVVYRKLLFVTDRINITIGCLALKNPEYFTLTDNEYLFKKIVGNTLNHKLPNSDEKSIKTTDISLTAVTFDGKEYDISVVSERNELVHVLSMN